MGKIIVSENVTIDGVVQDPVGDGGFRHGGWGVRLGDADREAWAKVLLDEALAAQALLLGRRSDEWFAARWLSRTGPWADRLNSMPKYVMSSTLDEPRWTNSTVLSGDVASEVTRLRDELAGDIVLNGSIQLAHALLEHDLVDELRLIIFPVVLGDGERLLGETSDQQPMRLAGVQAVGDSLALLTYERDRAA
jgi:dihydrofolate reductase